jgi:hypothetical protein
VNFSKENKNKYIAYNAETLEDMITQFFEGHLTKSKEDFAKKLFHTKQAT